MREGSKFLKALKRIEEILVIIAQVCVLLLMLVTVANIVARFLGFPIAGAYEFGVVMIVFILYLGLAYTQSQHGHVSVDIVTNHLSSRTRETLTIITLLVGFIILSLMFWRTALEGVQSFVIKEYEPGLIPFPIWPGKLVVPFGIFFFIVQIIIELIQLIYKKFAKDSPGEAQGVKI